jgi:VIT1/CCC1 family predicted Fe2+/Mn2+ transporter
MAERSQDGRQIVTARRNLGLSEQTHLQILDYFQIAENNSQHPAIRDAAIGLAKDASRYRQKQDAKLSPNVAVGIAVLMLAAAGVASWYFFVYSPAHALILSGIAIGLALIAACLLAMFAGRLSQENFIQVLTMVWSKITGWMPALARNSDRNQLSEQTASSPDTEE